MNIKEIEITGLFGTYHHVISFTDADIKFIYGTNGIGKTTILNLLDWLFHLNLTNLAKIQEIPFESFSVRFEDEKFLYIRQERNNILSFLTNFEEREYDGIDDLDVWEYNPRYYLTDEYRIAAYEFANIIKKKTGFKQVSPNTFAVYDNVVLSLQEIAEKYPEKYNMPEIAAFTRIPFYILEYIAQYKIALIPLNRLEENTINKCMEGLSKMLEMRLNKFNQLSDELKQSQRSRLKSGGIKLDWNLNEISEYSHTLKEKATSFSRLFIYMNHAFGIDFEFPKEGTELEKQLFYIEIQDFAKQFSIYEEDKFNKRLQTYSNILKHAFSQSGNKVLFMDELNSQIKVKYDDDEDIIPLHKLSSGEQQQIILWYKILFEIPNNSLILIDEPETSLHIDWQMDFLPNLQAVQAIKPLSFLIATHSSAIINGHFELAKSLNDEEKTY